MFEGPGKILWDAESGGTEMRPFEKKHIPAVIFQWLPNLLKIIIFTCNDEVPKALLVGQCEKSRWASSHVLFTAKQKINQKSVAHLLLLYCFDAVNVSAAEQNTC